MGLSIISINRRSSKASRTRRLSCRVIIFQKEHRRERTDFMERSRRRCMEPIGLEPMTHGMQSRRSTH